MCLLFINTLVAPFELSPMNFLLLSYEYVVMSDDDDDDDDDDDGEVDDAADDDDDDNDEDDDAMDVLELHYCPPNFVGYVATSTCAGYCKCKTTRTTSSDQQMSQQQRRRRIQR